MGGESSLEEFGLDAEKSIAAPETQITAITK
jgi:hypothetical protein